MTKQKLASLNFVNEVREKLHFFFVKHVTRACALCGCSYLLFVLRISKMVL